MNLSKRHAPPCRFAFLSVFYAPGFANPVERGYIYELIRTSIYTQDGKDGWN